MTDRLRPGRPASPPAATRRRKRSQATWDILHIVEPAIGGAPAVAAQLASWEAASGLRVGLVGHPDSPALQRTDAPFDTIALDLSLGPSALPSGRVLAHSLGRTRVVHLHSTRAALIGRVANLRHRRPAVFTPHGWSWHAAPGRVRPAVIAAERLLAHAVEVLHVLSDAEAEEASRLLGMDGDHLALIPNGVDLGRFTCPPRRSGAGTTRPLEVLVIGRLCRQKGQDLLFGALAAAAPERPVHLTIAGEGPAEAELRQLAGALPDQVVATFVGPVADPVPLYHATDLAVFPSRWEGQSLALLEAIATGCPIIATAASGTEVGDGCIATCEPSVDGLAEALRRHLASPALLQALADAARGHREAVGEARVRDLHLALKYRMLSST